MDKFWKWLVEQRSAVKVTPDDFYPYGYYINIESKKGVEVQLLSMS